MPNIGNPIISVITILVIMLAYTLLMRVMLYVPFISIFANKKININNTRNIINNTFTNIILQAYYQKFYIQISTYLIEEFFCTVFISNSEP